MPRLTVETPLTGKTKSGRILSEQEERFCQLYVQTFDRMEATIQSYNVDQSNKGWRFTVSNIASENLKKPYVNERIRELLDKYHLNDESVDNELSFLLRQNESLPDKRGAIEIYNKLKNRYEKHQDAGANKVEFIIKERNSAKK
jgi:phage terminase small subunit